MENKYETIKNFDKLLTKTENRIKIINARIDNLEKSINSILEMYSDNFSQKIKKNNYLSNLLAKNIENDKMDFFLQSVVFLPENRMCFLEAYSILKDGKRQILPKDFIKQARAMKLISLLDFASITKIIQLASNITCKKRSIPIFVNLSKEFILNPNLVLTVLQSLNKNSNLYKNIFFELKQEYIHDKRIIQRLESMQVISSNMLVLGLDHITDINLDYKLLNKIGVKFLKLDSKSLPSSKHGIEYLKTATQNAKQFNINFIVEKIEEENDIKKTLQCRINYAQGFLFSNPSTLTKNNEKIA